MPHMIPDDIEQFTTPGEESFYFFLRKVAKPDDSFLCWYSPDIHDTEPDFVLFCHDIGLIVFEVKDWAIDQIREVSPKKFLVNFGNKEVSCTNPHEQAKSYVYSLLSKLAQDGRLVTRDAFAQGKPKIPISYGVVFTNINSFEYRERFANDGIIPLTKIFFWDDLEPHSELCDPSGKQFLEALKNRFEPKFPCHISNLELNHLRQLLFPTIRINPVQRGPQDELKNLEENIRLLDHHQEAIARKFDRGHRIISGPSGSGKTLVLVHQANFLLKYNPGVRKILFLCYNATLVNYIRRLLANQATPLGANGVEVMHFYELCERLTGEKLQHENQDADYYEIVLEEALSRDTGDGQLYDAILVDEGQDFSDQMLRVVMGCLNKKTDFLTIAMDEGQDIYAPVRSWKELGINIKGRKRQLNIIYRNTREITAFANRFRYGGAVCTDNRELADQSSLFLDPHISNGPTPVLKKYDSFPAVFEGLAKEIRKLVDEGKYPLSEIAIIYTSKKVSSQSADSLPALVATALDNQGLLNKWLSEDYRAKRTHDITANSVTITTIHSAKGLDFACVYLVGLDSLEPNERWTEAQIKCLCYVGMTRARYQLTIPYLQETPLIDQLRMCLNEANIAKPGH